MNKIRQWLIRFMAGRYGTDKLNTVLLTIALVTGSVPLLLWMLGVPISIPLLVLTLISYGLTGYVLFRCLSRNTYKRYEENRKFLRILDRIKDRKHRYYDCPQCHQTVRVPRGKGKIAISCPKCKEKFIRKT